MTGIVWTTCMDHGGLPLKTSMKRTCQCTGLCRGLVTSSGWTRGVSTGSRQSAGVTTSRGTWALSLQGSTSLPWKGTSGTSCSHTRALYPWSTFLGTWLGTSRFQTLSSLNLSSKYVKYEHNCYNIVIKSH